MADTYRTDVISDDIDRRLTLQRRLKFLDNYDEQRKPIAGKSLDSMRKSMSGQRKLESEAEEDLSSSVDSSDHSSDSAASSESEKKKSRKTKAARRKRSSKKTNDIGADQLATILAALKPKSAPVDSVQIVNDPLSVPISSTLPASALNAADIAQQVVQLLKQQGDQVEKKGKAPGKTGSKVAYKRVDQVYDRKIHNYKLKETVHADPQRDEWDQVCSANQEI